jgi:ribosome maturation factor RimP
MAAQSTKQLQMLLEPVVGELGYDLEAVAVTAAGRRSVVRVVVDGDEGLDLDAVAEISRAVSTALDDTDVMGESAYVLEVSSPGVDRPLTEPRHWRRAAGRLVTVAVGEDELTARVVEADESVVTFDVSGETRQVPLAELGPGTVQLEFS